MTRGGTGAAWLVVLGGVAAAIHVGKLPPAIPVLREAMGMTLVESGFLLSLVQLAGMTLGLAVGLASDVVGLKRTMVTGLLVVGAASIAGGWAGGPGPLLALRALEGFGFLAASMPAPALIRRLVAARRMSAMLGVWGAYMPFATAAALLLGPAWIAWGGWQAWWWGLGAFSLVLAGWLAAALPADPARVRGGGDWSARVRATLRARGPWIVALAFGAYSAQWLAVIGFLPSIYLGSGFAAHWAAAATALAAGVNMVGSLAAGRLLERGIPAHLLLATGFSVMGLGGFLAYADAASKSAPWIGYGAVLAFSMVGGVVPGTLFSLAVRTAPSEGTVSTTVGWMQQWSAFGQFAGPPLVAWVAALTGGWQWSWVVTGGCATCGLLLAAASARPARRA